MKQLILSAAFIAAFFAIAPASACPSYQSTRFGGIVNANLSDCATGYGWQRDRHGRRFWGRTMRHRGARGGRHVFGGGSWAHYRHVRVTQYRSRTARGGYVNNPPAVIGDVAPPPGVFITGR